MTAAPTTPHTTRRRAPRPLTRTLAAFAVPMTAMALTPATATPAHASQKLTAKYDWGQSYHVVARVTLNEHETVNG